MSLQRHFTAQSARQFSSHYSDDDDDNEHFCCVRCEGSCPHCRKSALAAHTSVSERGRTKKQPFTDRQMNRRTHPVRGARTRTPSPVSRSRREYYSEDGSEDSSGAVVPPIRRAESQRNVKWFDMDDFLVLPSEEDQMTYRPRFFPGEETEDELPIRAFQNTKGDQGNLTPDM